MRNSFSSSIYNQGSKITKKQILDMIPSEISEMHQNGDIHIHDLEAFGKTTNCCTPNLLLLSLSLLLNQCQFSLNLKIQRFSNYYKLKSKRNLHKANLYLPKVSLVLPV